MAMFKIRVKIRNRPDTTYETDNADKALEIVSREIRKAKEKNSNIIAISCNNLQEWP